MAEKKFFNVASLAERLGCNPRHAMEISHRCGVEGHNFGGRGVRQRFMWTFDQVEEIIRRRTSMPNPKKNRRRNDPPLPEPIF